MQPDQCQELWHDPHAIPHLLMSKVKDKLSIHAMKTYGTTEVHLHSLLTKALDDGGGQLHAMAVLSPGDSLHYTKNNIRWGGWHRQSKCFQIRMKSIAQHHNDYTTLAPLIFSPTSAK